ncbi:MAG: choice-of-anchor L domain-containing protein, partial [Flavobacteriales bacterium]|nr:choice-of-anchor L domain-containing protein [Flavobacteriales bacterium]
MAQTISVTPATTTSEVQNYVENVLLGECVTVSNITFTGSLASGSGAIGEFGNGATLGIQDGLILSSGQAVYAVGPDNSNNRSFNHSLAGDPDLTDLANNFTTYDAAILEFDFIPQSDTLRFNYVFGSEEYPEYVGSPYNDVFGFFLSGPGISGPYSGGAENIALIPGTTIAVTINNINNGYSGTEPATGPCNNCAYYVDNSSGAEVQYDAFTTVLTAKAVVVPCQTYHIKIAIADAGDGALDSGVFLEEGSFSASGGDPVTLETVTGVGGVNEGCDIGSFVFRRLPGSSNSNAITVGYNVAGTATPGVDYTTLPGTVTIPAGQDSVVLSIEGILDFTPEGNETVVLSLLGGGCTCTAPPVYTMNIIDNDVQLSLATTGSTTICQGESTNLTASASGSFGPYSGSWDNGAPAGSNVSVSPNQTTTYTYTVQDACGGQTLTSWETVTVITSDF